jgi:Rod binding domain-containing protein
MDIASVSSVLTQRGALEAHPKDTPEKIREAASQFEALLIGEVLKAAQAGASEGWMGTGDDPASASAMDFAAEYFARALASNGGLGLTGVITKGLEQAAASNSNRATTPEAPAGTPTDGR